MYIDDCITGIEKLMRSSYGLLGIVYEVTFRVKQLQAMAVKEADPRRELRKTVRCSSRSIQLNRT